MLSIIRLNQNKFLKLLSLIVGVLIFIATFTVILKNREKNKSIILQKWKYISTEEMHTIAIKEDGTLWVWGENRFGQLGDGTTKPHFNPIQIGADTNWQSISAGLSYSFAIKTDGTLWGWGSNSCGQLGDGAPIDRHIRIPMQIAKDDKWFSVSAGRYHVLSIKIDGTLWSWGSNMFGQLGDGTTADRDAPVQIGKDKNWELATAGEKYSVALKKDGTLWAWGRNEFGQLGDGTTIDSHMPVQIGKDNNWKLVTASEKHTIALKKDGTLWAWGRNEFGQLGDGTTIDSHMPVQIGKDNNWKLVTAGEAHTIAIKSDGTLWGWGNNKRSALGDVVSKMDYFSPIKINTENGWQFVATFYNHSLAIKQDRTLWAWGDCDFGTCGNFWKRNGVTH